MERVEFGSISACIAGDYRYTDRLTVWLNKDNTVSVEVRDTAPIGGMDGPGGTRAPELALQETTHANPLPSEVLRLVKKVLGMDRFNFRRYGKPTKNFRWIGAERHGLALALCATALKRAQELRAV